MKTLKEFAAKSKNILIAYKIYNNWKLRRRYRSGNIETTHGSSHQKKTTSESLDYINIQFEDYLRYSGLSREQLRNMRVLELGFGDNVGVALKFLIDGAAQVVCLDRFYSKRDQDQQHLIYQQLRASLPVEDRVTFDEIFASGESRQISSSRLQCINGITLEEFARDEQNSREQFDLIVSRAVIEEIYDPRPTLNAADKLLRPGGHMLHKIDMSDYGIFSDRGMHPLTFLTIPETVYRLMAFDSGIPNRKTINYYERSMRDLGYEARFFVSSIIGVGEVKPHKEGIEVNVDYSPDALALVENIRSKLIRPLRDLSAEKLIISGVFLVARKPTMLTERGA